MEEKKIVHHKNNAGKGKETLCISFDDDRTTTTSKKQKQTSHIPENPTTTKRYHGWQSIPKPENSPKLSFKLMILQFE